MQKGVFLIIAILITLSHQEVEIKEFDQDIAKKIFEEGNSAIIAFLNDKEHANELSAFSQAVENLGEKYFYCKANIHEGMGTRLADYIGVTDDNLPTIYLIKVNGRDMKKYKIEKDLTKENIIEFEKDYEEGKLTPTRKSEEIPETNDTPVKKIVGKNFQEIVMDPTKDVMIKIYAPWCGHCKQLAPIYEKVAQSISHNPNIIISEYDGTKNENEEISITGYPTVLFFPSNKKDAPITFSSSRTEEGIIEFLKQHTTHEWVEKKEEGKQEL